MSSLSPALIVADPLLVQAAVAVEPYAHVSPVLPSLWRKVRVTLERFDVAE